MSEPAPKPVVTTRRRLLELWWLAPVAAAGGFFVWFGIRSYRILLGKPSPSSNPRFKAGPRVTVGGLDDFAALWDTKPFNYNGVDAVLMRVKDPQPGGLTVADKHFIALSRVCTHLGCTCEVIRRPEIASMAYKYRPEFEHPILGCACHFSAFDPERGGRSVSGPALEPLPRVQVVMVAGRLVATGIEG